MKLKLFIHAQWNKYSKEFTYTVAQMDMTEYGYVMLEEREIEFDIPRDEQIRNNAVKALRASRNRILAEASVKAQELDEEAQELLSLPAPTPDSINEESS